MANVLNKLLKPDNDVRVSGSVIDKKAYGNMMLYLKEMKLHNVKNLELAEQIYLLSENSVEKLNEMHEVLTEKIGATDNWVDAEELLQSTEHLQQQLGNLSQMVKQVYDRQESLGEDAVGQRETIENTIRREMGRMVDEGNASNKQVIAQAVQERMQAMGDEIAEYNRSVQSMTDKSQQVFEESLENHERVIKKEITVVREMMENIMEEQFSSIAQQLESTKKVVKWYTRIAMWTSCLAMIILFIDILILK